MKTHINKFSVYNPKYSIKGTEDIKSIKEKIRIDIQTKIDAQIVEVDNEFSIENFEYVTSKMTNEKIANIYQMLGPFDFSAYEAPKDELEEPTSGKGS